MQRLHCVRSIIVAMRALRCAASSLVVCASSGTLATHEPTMMMTSSGGAGHHCIPVVLEFSTVLRKDFVIVGSQQRKNQTKKSTMPSQNILLDSNIRDWVVLPLFVIMVAAGLLRFHMGNMLKPAPKNTT